MEVLFDVLKNSLLITGLVMVMMLLIEYINIHSQGRSFERLKGSRIRQIGLAALLGLIPGCIGGFAAVSLYTHGILPFGALMAMMISTVGDEAFVLFATVPRTALLLTAILFPMALWVGWGVDKLIKSHPVPFAGKDHYALHQHDDCQHGIHTAIWGDWKRNIKIFSFKRVILLLTLLAFVLALGFGLLEHEEHEAAIFSEQWINLLFALLGLFTVVLTAMANEHFISEHLWGHIILKHLPRIFLWTFGALLFIAVGLPYLHIDLWVAQNGYFILLVAALIGLIPESGPHLIFIALFASGVAPFSVLFTSSFVQDGHTALPLLAESKKAFVKAKAIKFTIGLTLGSLLYFCGL
ncbi:MAG: putative manganese transporter [Bacteroidetes bacterium]|nr:putative manganese transporter [Bacteroidota bacterium]